MNQYAPGLGEDEVLDRVRRARGERGANRDYIVNTCAHLEAVGVRAPGLARLRDALLAAPASG